jgi:hypothetical protein
MAPIVCYRYLYVESQTKVFKLFVEVITTSKKIEVPKMLSDVLPKTEPNLVPMVIL